MTKYLKLKIEGEIDSKNYKEIFNLFSKDTKIKILNKKCLDDENLPTEEGIYFVKGVFQEDFGEIDVYNYEPKGGLCCYANDFGSAGTDVNDEHDCHVSVHRTGLEFLTKLRDLD